MIDVAFTVFSGIGLVLVLLPLPLQWRARNIGTLLNLGWLFSCTLINFINSILWWDSFEVYGHVWCDISVKLLVGFTTGMAAASLCINRRLAGIAAARSVLVGHKAKRRALVLDLLIGVGIPAVVMAVSYVFQPHRFDIMEGVGCEPVLWNCLATLLSIHLPPIALNVISSLYGAYAVHFFVSRRAEVHAVLKSSQSGLELSHYFRLIGLATADIVFGLPISLYFFTFNVQFLVPWGSWSRVHYDWMRVSTFSEEQVLPYPAASVKHYLSRWLCPLLCFVFFLFCGVGDDAIKQYRNWLRGAAKLLPDGWTPNPNTSPKPPVSHIQLGSTVVHPRGSIWASSPMEAEEGIFHHSDQERRASNGWKVAVTVEREVA